MSRNIKCTNCGAWNQWDGNKELECVECGKVIKDQVKDRSAKRKAFDKDQLDKWMFTIHESDSGLIKFGKKVGNVLYMIFMAIVGFIAWITAIMPG